MAYQNIHLQGDKVRAFINGDDSLTLDVNFPGIDTTNGLVQSQPVSAVGSGGQLTADGTAHSGACTVLGILVSCTTGGTIAFSDAIGAAGTALYTVTISANTSIFIPLPGVTHAVGVFADFTTLVGTCTVFVGPVVV